MSHLFFPRFSAGHIDAGTHTWQVLSATAPSNPTTVHFFSAPELSPTLIPPHTMTYKDKTGLHTPTGQQKQWVEQDFRDKTGCIPCAQRTKTTIRIAWWFGKDTLFCCCLGAGPLARIAAQKTATSSTTHARTQNRLAGLTNIWP